MIYHVAEKTAWRSAARADDYRPAGFAAAGFIHFSTAVQLLRATLLIVICGVGCAGGGSALAAPATRYTLFAGGDTMLARWVPQRIYRHGSASAFAAVRDDIAGADLAITNLECVVASGGEFFAKGGRRPFYYRAPPAMLDVLTAAGFDLVTTANNHAMDYGPEALSEQLALLAAAGIASAGSGRNLSAARRPAYVQVGELVVAVISVEDRNPLFAATAERPGIFYAPQQQMLTELAALLPEARSNADLVIFSPHWGANWTDAPTAQMIAVGRGFIDLGGDAVLGHSSHHVHGVEVYRGRPIVYDMGSLFFDTVKAKRISWSAGWLLEFDREGFKKLTIKPYRLRSGRTRRADADEAATILDRVVSDSRRLDPRLRWRRQDAALSTELRPQPPATPRRHTLPGLSISNTSRALPAALRQRLSNAVIGSASATPPPRFRPLTDIELDNGVRVLGYAGSEAVRPHYGFVFELLLRTPGPLAGRWVAFLVGVNRADGQQFRWRYPVDGGGWTPEVWRRGQLVIDRTFVRPSPTLTAGTYDLFWGILNRRDGDALARPLAAVSGARDGLIPVGSIRVLEKGIPARPSGVDWDGRLPRG